MRTQSEWKLDPRGWLIEAEDFENQPFIAMCGSTARKLDNWGYDGEKAIELLPEILQNLSTLSGRSFCDEHCAELADEKIECLHEVARALISSLRR